MPKLALSIIGKAEILAAISVQAQQQGIATSAAVAYRSPADALDMPLNPDDLVQAAELIKVIFEAGTAGLTFVTALLSALRKFPGTKVEVQNAHSGQPLGHIDGTMTEQEASQALGVFKS